jgi:hypothetical protein
MKRFLFLALALALCVPVFAEDCECYGIANLCLFVRGDANCDGSVNMTDCVTIMDCYQNGNCPGRLDAADVNDDGVVNQDDWQYLLTYLFDIGSLAPQAPFPDPGYDCTADNLDPICSTRVGALNDERRPDIDCLNVVDVDDSVTNWDRPANGGLGGTDITCFMNDWADIFHQNKREECEPGFGTRQNTWDARFFLWSGNSKIFSPPKLLLGVQEIDVWFNVNAAILASDFLDCCPEYGTTTEDGRVDVNLEDATMAVTLYKYPEGTIWKTLEFSSGELIPSPDNVITYVYNVQKDWISCHLNDWMDWPTITLKPSQEALLTKIGDDCQEFTVAQMKLAGVKVIFNPDGLFADPTKIIECDLDIVPKMTQDEDCSLWLE